MICDICDKPITDEETAVPFQNRAGELEGYTCEECEREYLEEVAKTHGRRVLPN